MFQATIGRIGSHGALALFEDGSTVQDALNKFGLSVGSEERMYSPNGDLVNASDVLEEGSYTISKQQENGLK